MSTHLCWMICVLAAQLIVLVILLFHQSKEARLEVYFFLNEWLGVLSVTRCTTRFVAQKEFDFLVARRDFILFFRICPQHSWFLSLQWIFLQSKTFVVVSHLVRNLGYQREGWIIDLEIRTITFSIVLEKSCYLSSFFFQICSQVRVQKNFLDRVV